MPVVPLAGEALVMAGAAEEKAVAAGVARTAAAVTLCILEVPMVQEAAVRVAAAKEVGTEEVEMAVATVVVVLVEKAPMVHPLLQTSRIDRESTACPQQPRR